MCSVMLRELLAASRLKDLYGLTAFLRLEPLEDRGLFVRTIERPVKSGDPVGVARLQVLPTVALPLSLPS